VTDPITKPAHYTDGGSIEFLDALECCLSTEEYIGFLRGQIMKYLWRCRRKGSAEADVRKAAFYSDRLLACLKDDISQLMPSPTSSPNRLASTDNAD
tara:strand:+ start:259 stop:549 length:291 start_codon:yes stop_codon:yes gene_type:complete